MTVTEPVPIKRGQIMRRVARDDVHCALAGAGDLKGSSGWCNIASCSLTMVRDSAHINGRLGQNLGHRPIGRVNHS